MNEVVLGILGFAILSAHVLALQSSTPPGLVMSCHADSIIEHPYLDDVLAGYTLPASHNEPHFGSAIAFGKWNGDEHIDMAVGEIGATNKAGRTHTV